MWIRDRGKGWISSLLLVVFFQLVQGVFGVSRGGGYRSVGGMNTSYSCDGELLDLTCPENLVIKVMRANYGRFSLTVCNPSGVTDWSVNCMQPRSLRIVQDRCDGLNNCRMLVEKDIFGNPCPGTPKYLEIYYGCFQETTTTTSTTSNPLPPWLTTRSSLPYIPGLLDLNPTTTTTSQATTIKQTTTTYSTQPTAIITTLSSETTTESVTTTPPEDIATDRLLTAGEPVTVDGLESLNSDNAQTTLRTDAPENENKLVYAHEPDNRDSVRILLSTLPPPSTPSPTPSPDPDSSSSPIISTSYPSLPPSTLHPASPHSGTLSPLVSKCPPRTIRGLSWSWTPQGTMAQQSCPPGTTGLARWECRSTSSGESTWSTFFPDLSECESFWTKKIISELRRSDSIVTISTDLVQYVSANHLYGGDIMSIISALTIITEKMEFQMNTIPTPEQREAMVVEVAQSLLKVGSVLLEVENLEAWQDLPDLLRSKFVSGFMNTLDRFTVLLHTALIKDQELSISSPNLLLVLKKMSFRNIRGSKFPSLAARGSRDWSRYMDHADIPALVLMENMDADGAHVAFLASNNLDVLLSPGRGPTRTEVINSQVMRVSMGEPHLTVREPVILVLRHLSVSNVTQPRCVHWSEDGWSDDKCLVSWSNVTHTACECSTMGTFAILETIEEEEKLDNVTFMLTLVVSVTVTIITAVSLALLVFYCKKVKVRDEWKYRLSVSGLPCFQQKRRELTGNLYSTSPTFINQNMFTSSDFMVLSQSSLDVQHLDASHLQGYIEHVHQHQLQQQQHQQCHVQPQLTHLQHYTQQSVHNASVHNGLQADVQGGYHYTVGRSIPGPQVETKPRSGSKPQSFIQPGAQYGYEDAGHIYMEVDPFYSAHLAGPNPAYLSQTNLLPTQAHTVHLSHPLRPSNPSSNLPHSSTQEEFISSPDEEVCCSTPGLVSSNSSQSSSGYSTAPSEQYYTHGGHFRPGVLRADTLRCSEPSSSPYPNLQLTKDQIFAISQSFESQSQIPQENFCGLTRGPGGSSRRKTREHRNGSRAQERGTGLRAQELPLLSLQDTHLI